MTQAFQTSPGWVRDAQDDMTRGVWAYWSVAALAGGALAGGAPLQTEYVDQIQTPIAQLMAAATNYGFYEIPRIRKSRADAHHFYDVAVLATGDADAKVLSDLQRYPKSTKCCWEEGIEPLPPITA